MPTVSTLQIDTGTLAALASPSCVAVGLQYDPRDCHASRPLLLLLPLLLRPDRVVLRALPRRRPHPLHSLPSRLPAARRERDAVTRELFPNDSIRPPTTATPPSLSPRTPPSRPCTLADEKWEVLSTSGAGCVRVALFKDERRGEGGGAMAGETNAPTRSNGTPQSPTEARLRAQVQARQRRRRHA